MNSLEKEHLFTKHNVLLDFDISKRISLKQYIDAYQDIADNANTIDDIQAIENKHFGNKQIEPIPGIISPSHMLDRNLRNHHGSEIANFIRGISNEPKDWTRILEQAEDDLFDYYEGYEEEYEDDEWDEDDVE
jgi:hypothetical protein